MIPRTLPTLARQALANGWDVHTKRVPRHQIMQAQFQRCFENVYLEWDITGPHTRLTTSRINGTTTPFTQCARLLRSTGEEG